MRYLASRLPRGLWRELLFEDVGLKLLALAITLGLWYGVTAQRAPITVHLRRLPLSFRVSSDVVVDSQSRETVNVTLKGSRQTLGELSARDLSANVKVDGQQAGTRVVSLTPENLELALPDGAALPGDVKVERVDPESVTLNLEALVEREVEVQPAWQGRIAEGYAVRRVEIVPGRMRIRGTESAVKAVERLLTEPIKLEGRTVSFAQQAVAVVVPDEKVKAMDRFVDLKVEVSSNDAPELRAP